MANIKITVIVPTYKPQAYLWECLDSLYFQSLDSSLYEIIVVLNGERADYEDKIKEYIHEHPSVMIQYLYAEMPGVSNARNIALDIARGKYIAFIDDDDYVSKSYLRELLEVSSPDTIG